MQVTTLYSSYDEYNIDMDILGKVVSIPQLSRDELKEIVFKELQETHPIPKLEDERYKLSRPVDEDYKVQVENYVQQFEDEDLSVDKLGEDEDPYNQGTDKEDIYAIGDIYGLDINIFSSPFTEDEVEQATKDIESFLSQKVRRFKQNKAEYEKESVVSLEELRAMYQTRVHIQDSEEQDDKVMEDTISLEENEAVSEEQADEVIEDTLSLEEKEEVPEEEEGTKEVVSDESEGTDENYFISEPSIPFIRVLIPFISEPDVPYIEVRGTEEQLIEVEEKVQPTDVEEKESPTEEVVQEPTFIEEPPVDYIQVTTETNPLIQESKSPEITFIEEPPVDFIQVSNSTPEDSNVEIESTEEVAYFVDEPSIPYIVVSSSEVKPLNQGTASDENSDFFIEEPDISFINVYSSENQEYSEEGNDSDSDFTYEGSDEDDPDAYEMDEDDEDYDGDEGEEDEDDSVDEEDGKEGTYDEEDEDDSYDEEDEDDSYDEEPEEKDEEDDSTVEAEEDGTYDAEYVSYDEADTDSSGDDSFEEYDDSLEGYEEDFEGEDDSVDEDDDVSAYEDMTDSEDLDEDGVSYEAEEGEADSTVEEEEHTIPTPIPQAVKVPSKPVVPEQEIQVKPRASALTKRVQTPTPEPAVQSPKTSVTPQVKEKKGSDTLSSKKVSESLDLEVSFMNKSKVTDTKPKASTSGIEITRVPKDLVEFLRLYPRTPYKVAVQYFGEKEVKRQLKMGRVYQNGKYLVI